MFESSGQDLRYAVRTLRKRPGFLALVVVTLAIGVGSATTIFSVVNGILLTPLPYEESSDLVALGMQYPDDPYRLAGVSVPNFEDWRDRSTTLEGLGAAAWMNHVLVGDGTPEGVRGGSATADFFSVLRVQPQRGRLFVTDDYRAGPPVAVISHALWQRRFGGAENIVGRDVRTRDGNLTIVGVLPAGFEGPEGLSLDALDIWTPFVPSASQSTSRGNRPLVVFGRRQTTMSLQATRAEFEAIGIALAEAYPDANTDREGRPWLIGVNSLQKQTVHSMGRPLVVLLAAVGMLLLIGCVNVANLYLARGTERAQELSVRTALGAGRGRMVRQLLTESMVTASLGGLAGTGLAFAGVAAFRRWATVDIPRLAEVTLDERMLVFAAVLATITGLVFGLVPALRASRVEPGEALKSGTGRTTSSRGLHRLRRGLVATETALALVLVVGAGLLFNSLIRMIRVEPGFEPDRVLAARITLDDAYPTDEARLAFWGQLRERVEALPGVERAAIVLNVPLQGTNQRSSFVAEGMAREDWIGIDTNPISAGYFETVGIELVSGRDFAAGDGNGESVMIVNAAMARRFWGHENPIGRRVLQLESDDGGNWHTVVGLVADHKQNGVSLPSEPMAYVPHAQIAFFPRMHILARTAGGPATFADALRQQVWALDANLPIASIGPLADRVRDSVAEQAFYASLLSLFAWMAVVLAAVGVYGTMAYVAGQRTRELGIRLALGASSRGLKGLLVWEEMRVIFVGLVIGLATAAFASRLLTRFMYEVTPTDPLTLGVAGFTLAIVALVACYLPARRASRVDPMETLRD